MNKFIGAGRLCAPPEIRYSQNGVAIANFNLAISNGYGDKQKTDFLPIVVFQKLAEICGNNLTKGSQIIVEGRIQVRNYETQDGQKRYATEVIAQNIEFMGSKKQSDGQADSGASSFGSEVTDEEINF
jgi:single-strand DNA-binding protein